MITTIGMAYEGRNFFGELDMRLDQRNFNINREHVLKAINYIPAHPYEFPCAHFDIDGGISDGGTHEVIYQKGSQRGTDTYTWEHSVGYNSKDVSEIGRKELLKVTRDWMKEPFWMNEPITRKE